MLNYQNKVIRVKVKWEGIQYCTDRFGSNFSMKLKLVPEFN